jgi:hypothetical protein
MKKVISKKTSNIAPSLNRLHREYIACNKNNNYPRKSLNGLTPIEKAHEMWGKDFKLPAFLEKQEEIPK